MDVEESLEKNRPILLSSLLLGLMPLYFGHILLYPEAKSTVVYHIFILLCCLVPLVSAILADGYFGRFKTILLFSLIGTFGCIITVVASTRLLHESTELWSLIGFGLIALGSGGMMPCVAAFLGDQVELPVDSKILQSFSTFFYLTAHVGSLAGMISSPILRTSVSCFGYNFCYALGFGVPTVFMIASVVVFLFGSPFYVIHAPKENMIVQFFGCIGYAIFNKIRLKNEPPRGHWLDYASQKYDAGLIRDIKIILSIFLLFLPLPIFWSLFAQQGSRWTLQATKLYSQLDLLGIEVHPDQVQAVGPILTIILIPTFNNIIYPNLSKWNIMTTPLQRMTAGGITAGLAFIAAGMLELHLDSVFPPVPSPTEAQAIVFNTAPCEIDMSFEGGEEHFVPSGELVHVIAAPRNNSFQFRFTGYSRPCHQHLPLHSAIHIHPLETKPVVIDYKFGNLVTHALESEDISKLLSGKPKLKLIYLRSGNKEFNEARVTLYSCSGTLKIFSIKNIHIAESPFAELSPTRYKYDVTYYIQPHISFTGFADLQPGGVYSLVLREVNDHIVFAHRFVIVPPNTTHILWILPQYIILCIAEILFVLSGMEFCFTQAPCSMKTVVMATWYFTMACGNLFVIFITHAQLFSNQASEYFLFAGLVIIDALLFYWACLKYNLVVLGGATSEAICEVPLLMGLPSEQTLHVVIGTPRVQPRVLKAASESALRPPRSKSNVPRSSRQS